MKTSLVMLLFFALFTANPTFSAPKIILKLDDLSVKNGICPCIPTFDYLMNKQIKAGFGAIANRFDNTTLNTLQPYLNANNENGEPLFEIWHHGLDHVKPELLKMRLICGLKEEKSIKFYDYENITCKYLCNCVTSIFRLFK